MAFPKLDSSVVPADLVGSDNTVRANVILTWYGMELEPWR